MARLRGFKTFNNEKMQLNDKLIERLIMKIIIAESNNLKTKAKTDAAMINEIKKWIEEGVKCL